MDIGLHIQWSWTALDRTTKLRFFIAYGFIYGGRGGGSIFSKLAAK